EVLLEGSLHPEAAILALVLYANVVLGEEDIAAWFGRWPETFPQSGGEAVALVPAVLPHLRVVDRDLGAAGAMAALALIAPAPAESLSLKERTALRDLVPQADPGRRYAEFLAVLRLAAAGERFKPESFPGYAETLARTPLRVSSSHLAEVYMSDGPDS